MVKFRYNFDQLIDCLSSTDLMVTDLWLLVYSKQLTDLKLPLTDLLYQTDLLLLADLKSRTDRLPAGAAEPPRLLVFDPRLAIVQRWLSFYRVTPMSFNIHTKSEKCMKRVPYYTSEYVKS